MSLPHGLLSRVIARDLRTCFSVTRCLATPAAPYVPHPKKTRWMPTAPSKVYRVPKRPEIPKEDIEEIKRLYNNYRTSMKSLKQYLRADWEERQRNRAQPGHVMSPEEEEAEHRQLMEYNRAENARMAAEREQRLSEQTEAIYKKVERLQQAALEQQQKDHETAVKLIRTQEEISRMYIPREKLEEAIEAAMANETDYNYSIDKNGNRYEGRFAKPS